MKRDPFPYLLYFVSVGVSLLFFYIYSSTVTWDVLDHDEIYFLQEGLKIRSGSADLGTLRPIGHPLLLAFFLSLSDNLIHVQLMLILVSSFSPPLFYLLMKKLTNQTCALVAACVLTIWPTRLFYAVSFFSQTAAFPIFLLFLLTFPRWYTGIILGTACLFHPSFLFFLPFVFVITAAEKIAWKKGLSIALTALLTIMPWSLFISLQKGQFILLSTNGASALSGGINPNLYQQGYQFFQTPDGRISWRGPGLWLQTTGHLTEVEENSLPPREKNALLMQRTLQWIRQHPLETLYLEMAKWANLWGFYPLFFSLPYRLWFGYIPLWLIECGTLFALIRYRKKLLPFARLWTLPIFISMIVLVSCGSWRYRYAADAALIAFSTMLFFYFPKQKKGLLCVSQS
ncbi:MAG: hypothetical protein KDK65_03420 [Chlamydiia bacterium]|nr:hypothetical protein [Chlamydiia bacterium]